MSKHHAIIELHRAGVSNSMMIKQVKVPKSNVYDIVARFMELPSQQCNAGPAKALRGQLCGPSESSSCRNRTNLAAGPAMFPYGFNRMGFVAA